MGSSYTYRGYRIRRLVEPEGDYFGDVGYVVEYTDQEPGSKRAGLIDCLMRGCAEAGDLEVMCSDTTHVLLDEALQFVDMFYACRRDGHATLAMRDVFVRERAMLYDAVREALRTSKGDKASEAEEQVAETLKGAAKTFQGISGDCATVLVELGKAREESYQLWANEVSLVGFIKRIETCVRRMKSAAEAQLHGQG